MLDRRNFVQGALAAGTLTPVSFGSAKAGDGFIEITAKPAHHKLYKEQPSVLWTYNGLLPGPEIRVRRGERVRVRFKNELDEPSSIHWHGIRIDNRMDGVSGLTQEAVQPGAVFEYDFVAPDAGTYWYHAHNKSWNQVTRGLYGPLIVEEEKKVFAQSHDLTLILDDWRLDSSGQFDDKSLGAMMDWSHAGRLGNWLTVNGKSFPTFELQAGQHHRIRLINTCNARTLRIDPKRFDGKILAFDGQPLQEPVSLAQESLAISSAQRVDLLITPKKVGEFAIEEVSSDQPYEFARFKVTSAGKGTQTIAPRIIPNSIPEPDVSNSARHPLHMTGGAMGNFDEIKFKGKTLEGSDFREAMQFWAFNGTANLADRPIFSAKKGETIILETFNDTAFEHAIHLHGHHFKTLERSSNGGFKSTPWRDTILLGRQEKVELAFVADNPGKWLMHCHMLEHAAAGMNSWFEVI